MRTLCIVDPALKDFVGHHFEYSRCLSECAAERGEPVLILAHRQPDERLVTALPIERVFRRSPYDFPTTIPIVRDVVNPNVQNYVFFQDLRQAMKGRCSSEWIVFAPAMTHNQIIGWAAWLQTIEASACPTVVLCVRNSYCQYPDPKRYNRRAWYAFVGFKWLERLASAGRRIHLTTDSECLALEFSRLTRLPMPILPTPHTKRAGRLQQERNSVTRFVWLGGIRTDKGFLTFADAILSLEPELRSGCIEFVIQSNLDSQYDTETAAARERLKSASLPGVTLIERALSREEYSELLHGASAVVIPRLLQLYRSQTSGPFVEALAAGKPVVVTDESWMSDQLKRYGAGVTFKDQNAESLADAMRALAGNYEDFRVRAEQSSREWSGIHNPDHLYDLLRNAGTTMKGL
jgi:glycosyltransferase involved in cell wall biosynthesis